MFIFGLEHAAIVNGHCVHGIIYIYIYTRYTGHVIIITRRCQLFVYFSKKGPRDISVTPLTYIVYVYIYIYKDSLTYTRFRSPANNNRCCRTSRLAPECVIILSCARRRIGYGIFYVHPESHIFCHNILCDCRAYAVVKYYAISIKSSHVLIIACYAASGVDDCPENFNCRLKSEGQKICL